MYTKVFPILSQNIANGDVLIVGVSGGPDSTALLDLLLRFSEKIPVKIVVAHVNHGIRGNAAAKDETFVKNLAKKHHLAFEVKRAHLQGSALEERGRAVRRNFFQELRKKHHARFILTAHTEDDQIETIIFNFLRGSGPGGLAGMKLLQSHFFKPLLGIPKSEILAYLKSSKLVYRIDATNKDTHFRRNFIRKKILPLLTNINPSFRKTLLRNRTIFAGLDEWTKAEAKNFLEKNRTGNSLFPLAAYEKLPHALQHAVIQEAYRMNTKKFYALPLVKVEEIARLLARRIGNKKILCAGGGGFLLKNGVASAITF